MEERVLMIVHDLEEKIMDVWGTATDLDAVLHWIDDDDNKQTPEQDDHLMNMVIGIKSLHEQKSKILFEEFEKVLKSNGKEEKMLEEEIEKLKKIVNTLSPKALAHYDAQKENGSDCQVVEMDDPYGGKVKLVTREEFQDAIGQSAYEPEV